MKVLLINFHCIITWAIAPDSLINFEFVTQVQRGKVFVDLVVIREKYYKNRLGKLNIWK
jgi:hypothetical protein